MLFVICAVVLLAGPLSTIIHRVRDPKEKWQFPFVLKRTIVDATDSPWFEMVSFTEFFMMSYFAIIIINVDSVLSAIIAQLSTQLVILGYTFRNIEPRGIYDLVNEVEELLNILLMTILITGMGHLCFLLYSSSLYPTGSLQFIQMVFYWCILVTEDSMFCYWGNELTLCAAALAGVVFDCGWEYMPPKVARNIVFVIQRAQRPLYLTAGKFAPVSLQALLAHLCCVLIL